MTVLPSARPLVRPTARIVPSWTVTSASRMRRAGSIVTTRPPFSRRGRTQLGRDPRPRGGRVVRQVEIRSDLVQQFVVSVHAGEDLLGSPGLDDHVAEGIIQAGQEDRALLVVRQRDVHGVRGGGEQLDTVTLEYRGDQAGIVGHVVERRGLVIGGGRKRPPPPEKQPRRAGGPTRR